LAAGAPPTAPYAKSCLVFLGSSFGVKPDYRRDTEEFGRLLADRGYVLVYGGATSGLMGVVADGASQAGGAVHGVITEDLVGREIAHRGLARLETVSTMHERKARMLELSTMIVGLPGGIGTWEELLEALTFAQLGYHDKPIGVLNTQGYYDPLIQMLDKAVQEGFMRPELKSYLVVGSDPADLLNKLENYAPTRVVK